MRRATVVLTVRRARPRPFRRILWLILGLAGPLGALWTFEGDAAPPAARQLQVDLQTVAATKLPQRSPATETQFTSLEHAVQRAASPSEAFRTLVAFQALYEVNPAQTQQLALWTSVWKQRLAQGETRAGTKWISADAAREGAEKGDQLINEAVLALEQEKPGIARGFLERASRADPGGIRAEFAGGLLESPLGENQPPAAHSHFKEVLRRAPGNLAALNNLAIVEIRLRHFESALSDWEEALKIVPGAPEVVHNLRYFVSESQKGTISPGQALTNRAQRLVEKSASTEQKPAAQAAPVRPWLTSSTGSSNRSTEGWKYLPPLLPAEEVRRTTLSKTAEKYVIGRLAGCFIAPQRILTSGRMVAEADEIAVAFEAGSERMAKVLAFDAELDVALLAVQGIPGETWPVATSLPADGAPAILFQPGDPQRPRAQFSGIRTVVLGHSPDGQFVYLPADGIREGGGGPLVDQHGRLFAIHWGTLKGKEGAVIVGATCTACRRRFAEQWEAVGTGDASQTLSSLELIERASEAWLQVRCYKFGFAPLGLAKTSAGRSAISDPLVDTSCNACGGTGEVTCPARGCIAGATSQRVPYRELHGIGVGRRIVQREARVKTACSTCGGSGEIPCPHCKAKSTSPFSSSGKAEPGKTDRKTSRSQ